MLDQPTTITLKRPDKVVAAILVTAALGVFGVGLYLALPYLIRLAANTAIFIGEIVGLLFLAALILDRNNWIAADIWLKNVSRRIRRKVIADDPVGTISSIITRLEARMSQVQEHLVTAMSAWKRLNASIKEFAEKAANCERLATVATSEAMQQNQQIAAVRWSKSAEKLQPQADQLALMIDQLKQAVDLCRTRLDDLTNQREVYAKEFEATTASRKAVSKLRGFFGSNPEMDMLQIAVDEIEMNSAHTEAEIDQFVASIKPMIETAHLQRAADAQEASTRFGKFLGTANPATALLPSATDKTPVASRGAH